MENEPEVGAVYRVTGNMSEELSLSVKRIPYHGMEIGDLVVCEKMDGTDFNYYRHHGNDPGKPNMYILDRDLESHCSVEEED